MLTNTQQAQYREIRKLPIQYKDRFFSTVFFIGALNLKGYLKHNVYKHVEHKQFISTHWTIRNNDLVLYIDIYDGCVTTKSEVIVDPINKKLYFQQGYYKNFEAVIKSDDKLLFKNAKTILENKEGLEGVINIFEQKSDDEKRDYLRIMKYA